MSLFRDVGTGSNYVGEAALLVVDGGVGPSGAATLPVVGDPLDLVGW